MDTEPQEATAGPSGETLEHIVHHSALPQNRFSRAVDGAVERVGSFASWFWVALMLVICLNVFMKNVLHVGSIQLEEIQWHIYAAVFLLGLSYALVRDDHVRVDVIFERLGPRAAARVELVGILCLLLPFIIVLVWYTVPFVINSYRDGERSMSPGGLSNYWILKAVLLFALALVLLAAVSRLTRCIGLLRNGPARRGAAR